MISWKLKILGIQSDKNLILSLQSDNNLDKIRLVSKMKIGHEKKEKQRKAIILIVGALIIYIVFRYLLPYVLPFFCAYFIAKLLEPCVSFLFEKWKIPKSIAAFVSLLLFITVVGKGIYYLGKILIQQIGHLIEMLPEYQEMLCENMQVICHYCDGLMQMKEGTLWEGASVKIIKSADAIQNKFFGVLTQGTWEMVKNMAGLFATLGIMLIFVFMLLKDMEDYQKAYEHSMFYQEIHMLGKPLSKAGVAYLKTQSILILLIGCICTVGLYILKSEYALLFGIGIAVFDAFPVLGSGLILVPWALAKLLSKDLVGAIILLTLYLLCQCIRQFMEPKLLGDGIGINPAMTLGAIYVGIRLFGILGVILGPVAVVILKTLWNEIGKRKIFIDK